MGPSGALSGAVVGLETHVSGAGGGATTPLTAPLGTRSLNPPNRGLCGRDPLRLQPAGAVSPKTATARYTRRRTLRDRTSLQDRTSSSKSRPALGLVQSRVGLDTETNGGGPRLTGAGAESGVSRDGYFLLNRRSQMCRSARLADASRRCSSAGMFHAGLRYAMASTSR